MVELKNATLADVPALRKLVNEAYMELADMGLNYTGTYQDEEITRRRLEGSSLTYILQEGNELVGTISLSVEGEIGYLNQLAVSPRYRGLGLGRQLMQLAEEEARKRGCIMVKLDTAKPAKHLIEFYQSMGYVYDSEVQWSGKTYVSVVLKKVMVHK